MRILKLTHCLLIAAVLGLAGCADPVGQPLTPVVGKVTLDGKALTTGNVSFRPDTISGNNNAAEPYGEIGPDGTYKMFTSNRPGAPVGKYVVLVTASEAIDPSNPSATPKSLVNARYSDVGLRNILIEVTESPRDGQYDLKLKN